MKIITPGIVKPDVPEVFRCKCRKCDGVIEYGINDTFYPKRSSLGDSSRVSCPTPGCNEEMLHDFMNSVKYTDEERLNYIFRNIDKR